MSEELIIRPGQQMAATTAESVQDRVQAMEVYIHHKRRQVLAGIGQTRALNWKRYKHPDGSITFRPDKTACAAINGAAGVAHVRTDVSDPVRMQTEDEPPRTFYFFNAKCRLLITELNIEVEGIGTASTLDKFLSRKGNLSWDQILGEIHKKSASNAYVNATIQLWALGTMSAEKLQNCGVNTDRATRVNYQQGRHGGGHAAASERSYNDAWNVAYNRIREVVGTDDSEVLKEMAGALVSEALRGEVKSREQWTERDCADVRRLAQSWEPMQREPGNEG